MKYLALILLCASIGCASKPSVVSTGQDTYMLSKRGSTGFARMTTLKLDAYQEINEIAAKKGMRAEILDYKEIRPKLGDYPMVEVHYKLVP